MNYRFDRYDLKIVLWKVFGDQMTKIIVLPWRHVMVMICNAMRDRSNESKMGSLHLPGQPIELSLIQASHTTTITLLEQPFSSYSTTTVAISVTFEFMLRKRKC